MTDVSQILTQIDAGNAIAAEQLLPLVYDELRRMAAAKLAEEKPGQTLQATALVHEAYLRLVGTDKAATFANRRHFFCAAAEAMRRILIDRARHKKSLKGGAAMRRVDLDDVQRAVNDAPDDMLALDEALTKLAAVNQAAAEVVKLRLFAGMTVEEASDSLGLSRRTGFRHWTYARSFLQVELTGGDLSRSS